MDYPHANMADSSALRNLVRYAQINGFNLEAILSPELLEIVKLSEIVDRIPAEAIVDILELTAIIGRRPTIAIELSDWVDIHSVGMLSVMLDAAPTIAEALRIQVQYVHLESFALDIAIEEIGDEVMFRSIISVPAQFGYSQYASASLLVAIRLIRMTMGESWSPTRVAFEHQAPDDLRVYRALFRCAIEFGAERNAFFLPAEDLHKPLPRGNPRVLAYLEKHLESLDYALTGSTEAEVTRLISQNLSEAKANLATVSKAMGLQPRALQRRLANEGLEFSELLTNVRRQIVENFVRGERNPKLMQLAYRLGYTEASNASRFLRQHFGKGLRQLIRDRRQAKDNNGSVAI